MMHGQTIYNFNNCPRLLRYLIEIELNIELKALLCLNTSDRQYSLCTVLLTVRLAALKEKFLTELVAVPDLTLTDHTEYKELNFWWLVFAPCTVELSADSVLCCFVITSSNAEWNRKLWANSQSNVWSVDIAGEIWNPATAVILISWSPVSDIMRYSNEITQIFVYKFLYIFSNTAELVLHTYIHSYIHTYIHTYVNTLLATTRSMCLLKITLINICNVNDDNNAAFSLS